jgi:D-3-phosphoglycerate dehydrogenase
VRVLVAEPLGQAGIDRLEAEHQVDVKTGWTRDEFLAALPEYEALVVRSQVKVDAEAIAAGARLKVVGRAGVGVDNIDVDAATRAGIAVVNAPTANTLAAAEHTLALILALTRHVAEADASMRRGEWRRADFMGSELAGKTIGVVGLGRVGLAVADRARAFGMTAVGSDPITPPAVAAEHGVRLIDLDALLEQADIVTIHVPLAAATRGLIDAGRLALMKTGALIVNVARGGIVDEAALADALTSGQIGGAAIDVFEHEPVRDSPLLSCPHTVLTPHLGASTAEAQNRASLEVVDGVLDVLAGRPAAFQVNRPSGA